MKQNRNFRRRNGWLLAAYLAIAVACLLPAFGVAFNSARLVAGVPLSVLWLTVCFTAQAVMTCVAYRTIFRLWCEEVDGTTNGPSNRREKIR